MGRGRKTFHPKMVPEINKGYFWLPSDLVGVGTAGCRLLEGNRNPTFDMVQATSAAQPSIQTSSNGNQFLRFAANTTILQTAAAVTAGWTGATGVCMWLATSVAAPSGITSGNNTFFSHTDGVNQRRYLITTVNGSPDLHSITHSSTGTSTGGTTRSADTLAVSLVFSYCEWYFDPLFVLGGSLPAQRAKIFVNFVEQVHTLDAGTYLTTIFDANAVIGLNTRTGGLANVDAFDVGPTYYPNGIPSLKNRKRTANYLAPISLHFSV